MRTIEIDEPCQCCWCKQERKRKAADALLKACIAARERLELLNITRDVRYPMLSAKLDAAIAEATGTDAWLGGIHDQPNTGKHATGPHPKRVPLS